MEFINYFILKFPILAKIRKVIFKFKAQLRVKLFMQ